MRKEDVATHVAIAAPVPFVLRLSWVGTSRRMIAMALLRIAFGVTWSLQAALRTSDVGAAVTYSLVLWALVLVHAGRLSLDRLITARLPAWRRISG